MLLQFILFCCLGREIRDMVDALIGSQTNAVKHSTPQVRVAVIYPLLWTVLRRFDRRASAETRGHDRQIYYITQSDPANSFARPHSSRQQLVQQNNWLLCGG